VIVPGLVFLGACGKKAPGEPTPQPKSTTHELPQGPLEGLYRQIEADAEKRSLFTSTCDAKYAEIKIEIARFVDEASVSVTKELLANPPQIPVPAPGTRAPTIAPPPRKLGPLTLRPRVSIKAEATNTWTVDESASWSELLDIKSKIEEFIAERRFLEAARGLQMLDHSMRSLVPDEQRRRLFNANYQLTHDNLPVFASLERKMKACSVDSSCEPLTWEKTLSAEETSVMTLTLPYTILHQWSADKDVSVQERRERFANFSRWISMDVDFVSNEKTPAVRRLSAGNYKVFLDAKDLRGFEQDVITLVSELWSGAGRTVSIDWTAPTESFLSYSLNLLPSLGRGYVSHEARKIVLPRMIQYGTLHHELGHVLGLADRYYANFDYEKCVYSYESNPSDIMSDSSSGSVLQSHWNALETLYTSP
jgi:hypothetical protein